MEKAIFSILSFCFILTCGAQSVSIGKATPDNSAQLELESTNQGFLPPRMNKDQRDLIASPTEGLVIYNTSSDKLEIKTTKGWEPHVNSTVAFLPTIVVGTQQWAAKNLDVAFYRNGDPIPHVSDPSEWQGLSTGAWCYVNNDSLQATTYGKLYNWFAVNDPRGLAPEGWHIPTDAEWNTLVGKLGGGGSAGISLKEAGTSHWAPSSGPGPGNNNSGWTALPGGGRFDGGAFSFNGASAIFWSSTQYNGTLAWSRSLRSWDGYVSPNDQDKNHGNSVRVIKD